MSFPQQGMLLIAKQAIISIMIVFVAVKNCFLTPKMKLLMLSKNTPMFNFFKKKRKKKRIVPPDEVYIAKAKGKYFGTFKVGISNHTPNRMEALSQSMKTQVRPLMVVKTKNATEVETQMHQLFSKFHRPLPKRYDGSSEWFFTIFSVPLKIVLLWKVKKVSIVINWLFWAGVIFFILFGTKNY